MGSDKGDGSAGRNASDGDGNSSSNNTVVVARNRFEDYLNMKSKNNNSKEDDYDSGPGGTISEEFSTECTTSSNQKNTTQDDGDNSSSIWNHFTTPLNPTSQSSPPPLDTKPTTYNNNNTTPSIFSDLERSQTFDKFANIFMECIGNAMSSGKLSAAWQERGDSNGSDGTGGSGSGSIFSLLLTDYSPDAKDKNKNNSKAAASEQINPNDYRAERDMMTPHFTPIVWGSSCMVITLVSLRLGRWYQGRYVNTAFNSSTSSRMNNYTTSKSTNNNIKHQNIQDVRQTNAFHNNTTSFDPRKEEATNKLFSSLSTLPVDMALSMLTGISTTIFLTRPHYLMRDFAKSPLIEGKSVLAEESCRPFSEEMKNINSRLYTYTPYYNVIQQANNSNEDGKNAIQQRRVVPYSELWKDENLGEFDSLRAIRDFVVNCHERERRAKEEEQEAQERGKDDAGDDNDVFIC